MTNVTPAIAMFCVLTASALSAAGERPSIARTATTQSQGGSRTFEELRRSVAQATAPGALQIRLRWLAAEPVSNPAQTKNEFEVSSIVRAGGALRAERLPRVASTSLVVVSSDAENHALDWRIVPDPRIVRMEATSLAELAGERLYYTDIDFSVLIPDLPQAVRISLYKVRPEQGQAVLDFIGAVNLR